MPRPFLLVAVLTKKQALFCENENFVLIERRAAGKGESESSADSKVDFTA